MNTDGLRKQGQRLHRYAQIGYAQTCPSCKSSHPDSVSWFCLRVVIFLVGLLMIYNGQVLEVRSQENGQASQLKNRNYSCPNDLEILTSLLLRDIPSYANRVIQRSKRRKLKLDLSTYVIVAGKPEFEPLPLRNLQYKPSFPETAKQVFFTTLEQQYNDTQASQTQNYYWLFLTLTPEGWRFVTIFTQFSSPLPGEPPSPPQENSRGIMGQAINLWLRDCRAGTIKP